MGRFSIENLRGGLLGEGGGSAGNLGGGGLNIFWGGRSAHQVTILTFFFYNSNHQKIIKLRHRWPSTGVDKASP